MPLSLSRSYNAQQAGTDSAFGYGWTNSYGISLYDDTTYGSGIKAIRQENGSIVRFQQQGTSWVAAPRVLATLVQNGDGTWTFTRKARERFVFDATGKLIKELDLNSYATTLAYDASGRLTTVTDPSSRTLTFGYGGNGKVSSLTDTANRTVQYAYDGAGNLSDVMDVGGGVTHFGYDSSHRLTTVRDPRLNTVTTNTYDAQDRVLTQKDALLRTTTFDYISIPGSTKITDPKGYVRVDAYSSDRLLMSKTYGYGTAQAATWTYSYDANTLGTTSVTPPGQPATTSTYDASGNLLTRTDGLNHTTTYTYDALSAVTSIKDPNQVTTTFIFDAQGNLQSRSTPLVGSSPAVSQVTSYTYGDPTHPGDVTAMTDPDGKVWQSTYTANGDLSTVKDPLTASNTTLYCYDGVGRKTRTITPKGTVAGVNCATATPTFTWLYDTDPFGAVTTAKDPLFSSSDPTHHRTASHYDADHNLDSTTDADNNTTTYIYDIANQLTAVNRANGTSLTYGYDADGNRSSYTDGLVHTTTYRFDDAALPRLLTSETDPDNRTTTYAYDRVGNRLTKQDAGGNCSSTPKTGCTTFGYDSANELTSITYSDGATPNVSNIAYDADGQRTAMTDGTGTSHWSWDSLHRLTNSSSGSNETVGYGYDLKGQLTSIAYPGTGTVIRGYDDAGRLSSVRDWLSPSNTSSFGYDANSNLTTESLPNGVTNSYTYDAVDRLTGISDTKGPVGIFAANYGRDGAGELAADSSAPATSGAYKYTSLNQLCYAGTSSASACTAPPAGSTPYGYDSADNLTTNGPKSQAFDSANQLCWTVAGPSASTCNIPPPTATTFSYDNRGNRTSKVPPLGSSTCDAYDGANRLQVITTGTGANCTSPTVVGSYAYDGAGLRASKTVAGTTTNFSWDQSQGLPLLLQEKTGSSRASYVYGADGLPLEKITPSGATYWYHHDQLGSTRSFTDASGTPQATYTYDSYGNLTASTGAVANPLRFAGEYTDTESGLVYLRGRYFEPGTGQFLTRDPLEDVTRAPYGYAQENPLNLVDHTGQSAQGATGYQAAPKPPGMSDYDYQGYLHLVSDMNTWTCEDAQRAQQAAQEKAKHDAFEARLASLHAAEADARAADLNAPDLISDMASHVDTSVVKGAANTVNQALVTYGRSCMTGALGIGGAAVAAGLVSAGVGTVVVAGGGCLVTVGEQVVVQRLS